MKEEKNFLPFLNILNVNVMKFFLKNFLPVRTLQNQTKTRALATHSTSETRGSLFLSLSLSGEKEGKNNSGLFISLVSPAFERRAIFLFSPGRSSFSALPRGKEREGTIF